MSETPLRPPRERSLGGSKPSKTQDVSRLLRPRSTIAGHAETQGSAGGQDGGRIEVGL
jgi:hypothetical protein